MRINSSLPFFLIMLCTICTSIFAQSVVYKGSKGPGQGKHLVLVASDHEYRAEETIPCTCEILSVHGGFDCTVLFGVTDQGEIQAGISNIPGFEVLQKADGLVFFARFLALPPEQMKHLDEYFGRAGPVVGFVPPLMHLNMTRTGPMIPMLSTAFAIQVRNTRVALGNRYLVSPGWGTTGKTIGRAPASI